MKPTRRLIVIAIIVLALVVIGCIVALKLMAPTNMSSSTAKDVLTIDDLDKPDVKLDSGTTDASVQNLDKQLKAKIDKQIAAKENPFETVDKLAGVLADTTNTTRKDQLTDFVVEFMAKHEDALWFEEDSVAPDQAQVNYWKASLYAKLVYNYQFMQANQFTDAEGKLVDTTKDQLKYINLYLALAQDPASQSRATAEYKNASLGYTYSDTDNFVKLRSGLEGK